MPVSSALKQAPNKNFGPFCDTSLLQLHTAMFLSPAVGGPIGDAQLFKHLRDWLPQGGQHFGLTELANYLFSKRLADMLI